MRRSDHKPFMKKSKEKNKDLEEETKRMEERLQMLKSVLYKDLPKRTQPSEAIWNGSKGKDIVDVRSKPGSLLDMSKVKLKTLKRENIEVKMDHHYSDLISKVMKSTEKYITPEEKSNSTTLKCGQCEIKQASVSCQECNENYCARCFAQFHMKGALRRHHSLPLSRYKTRRVSMADDHPLHEVDQFERGEQTVEDTQTRNSQETPEELEVQSQGCQSGMDRYEKPSCTAQTETDEELRKSNKSSPPRTQTVGTSVDPKRIVPEINFTSSLTLAERIMVHQHRKSRLIPQPPKDKIQPETASPPLKNEEEEDKEESVYLEWKRPTFEQLHALATGNLLYSELQRNYQLEDLERSSDRVSTTTTTPTFAVTEQASADENLKSVTTRYPDKVEEPKEAVALPLPLTEGMDVASGGQNHPILQGEEYCCTSSSVLPLSDVQIHTYRMKEDEKSKHSDIPTSARSPVASGDEISTIQLIRKHLSMLCGDQNSENSGSNPEKTVDS